MINNLLKMTKKHGFLTMINVLLRLILKNIESSIFNKKFVVRSVHNYKMFLDVNDRGLSRALIMFKTREIDHKILLEKIIKKDMRIFDIGANIGYYALMELKHLDNPTQLTAFEPVESNYNLLEKNLNLNGYHNVSINHIAISDNDGSRPFYFSNASNLGSFHSTALNQGKNSAGVSNVQTLSYKSAVERFGAPNLIRMDVEGHEVSILSQVCDLVDEEVIKPTIIFETHLKQYLKDNQFFDILGRLFEFGYKVPYVASSQKSGTDKIIKLGYEPFRLIKTDGMQRGLFANLSNEHARNLITKEGGIRTVVLSCD